MNIIDARWETPEEKSRRVAMFTDTKDKKERSIKWCADNIHNLIKWHNEFEAFYIRKLTEKEEERRENNIIQVNENNKIFEDIKSGVKVYCRCGGLMRYIENYNFCGCENYRNKITYHNTYNIQSYMQETPITIEIGKSYLNQFKKHFSIPAMESIIFKTLKANGVKLLNDSIDDSYYSTARNASYESKKEENIFKAILENKFQLVKYQEAVRVYDGKEWKTKIPDYICYGDNFVYVFDAKIRPDSRDAIQLAVYHKAVEIITKKEGINKPVDSYYIVYQYEDYTNDELMQLRCFTSQTLLNYEFH